MKYDEFAVPFVRADNGSEDVIYLSGYSRADAEAWLAAQPKYCARILPARTVARILRKLEGEKAEQSEPDENVSMDLRTNSEMWNTEPLSEIDRERLGRALHNRSREINVMRLGDGSRVRVNGATFDFGAFMATLRHLIPDPDGSPGDK